jgi:GNAT superfamily N-acetyltransferase
MDLSESDAQALVTTLQDQRVAGSDDLELITWLSNKFRVGKSESRQLHDDFYRGFQHGADSVMPVIDGKTAEPAGPASGSAVYRAAYHLGQKSFTGEFARSLERNRPRGCLPAMCLLFLFLLVALIFGVGDVVCCWEGRPRSGLVVDEQHRSKGVGRAMIDQLGRDRSIHGLATIKSLPF